MFKFRIVGDGQTKPKKTNKVIKRKPAPKVKRKPKK